MRKLSGGGLGVGLLMIVAWVLSATSIVANEGAVFFESHIRPILKTHCFHCHGEEQEHGGELDVRLRRLLIQGGESGPAIVPHQPDESLLLELVRAGDMPKGDKKLKPSEIALLERWITDGAPTKRNEPETVDGALITEEERRWWAFRPLVPPPSPSPKELPVGEATTNPIDHWIQAKLKQAGLSPSPEAEPSVLIRRAFFDLIGLPPSHAEVVEFENACRDAGGAAEPFRLLVERLLARTDYGERWGRHWLDVVGYADSEGYDDKDAERPSAWRYRDYVIRALNADKPFDQFLIEQLAGDELIGYPKEGQLTPDEIDKLTATGFLRMAPDGTASANDPVARNAVITETVKIVSSSLLGMTVGCAECHDHRFDPILQKDFYRMRAIFEPGLNASDWLEPKRREISLRTPEDTAKEKVVNEELKQIEDAYRRKLEEYQAWTLDAELESVPEALKGAGKIAALKWQKDRDKSLTDDEKKILVDYPFLKVGSSEAALNLHVQRHKEKVKSFVADVAKHKEDVAAVQARLPKIGSIRALCEKAQATLPATRVFIRGNVDSPGEEVGPGDLSVLEGTVDIHLPSKDEQLTTSGRRLAYARHLTTGRHPLVTRVLVNRFWMHHFGRGMVASVGDFGSQGALPSHPELLDWLAVEFVNRGWSLKHFHRLVMNSATYRQASKRRSEAEAIDAENVMLWRMNMRRLEAETIRDATLAVTGRLNPLPFGEPVAVGEDANAQVVVGGGVASDDGFENRRSVYVQHRRSAQPYQLAVFDAPLMEPNCEVRNVSTVAPQSLLMMNSAFVVEQSRYFAQRVETAAGLKLRNQVRVAWQLAFGTSPSRQDEDDAVAFVQRQRRTLKEQSDSGQKALASLCQTLLGSNRFLYVE